MSDEKKDEGKKPNYDYAPDSPGRTPYPFITPESLRREGRKLREEIRKEKENQLTNQSMRK